MRRNGPSTRAPSSPPSRRNREGLEDHDEREEYTWSFVSAASFATIMSEVVPAYLKNGPSET
jgi:hypothetical protein